MDVPPFRPPRCPSWFYIRRDGGMVRLTRQPGLGGNQYDRCLLPMSFRGTFVRAKPGSRGKKLKILW